MSTPAVVAPAAPNRRRLAIWLALTALLVAAAYVLVRFVIDWPDWAEPVARQVITQGIPGTLRISAIAVAGSLVIGVVLGTVLTIAFLPSRWLTRGYVEVFRGLPILVTVFIVFFGVPAVWAGAPGWVKNPLNAAAIALILWGSAQVAEATRGAVQSIPREQHEAAAALGFGWVGRHVAVILPQALRRLLPPLIGLLVNIVQNSTLAAAIGGEEILQVGRAQSERLLFFPPIGLGEIHAFEIFAGVMLLFFVISFPLTLLARMLEKRLV